MKILIVILLAFTTCLAFSQSKEALEKIEAAKIGLITERLELTPEQAEKFWPIYKEFELQQRQLREEFKQLKRGYDPQNSTETENQALIAKGLQIKERQVNLEKTYSCRMQQVISSRQLINLRKAEADFRDMLMERLRNNQRLQLERQNRRRNDENLNRRRNN